MIGTVIMVAIIALLAGFLGTLVALKLQYRYLQSIQVQRNTWEHAQGIEQRNWEIEQEKRALALDAKLAARIQQIGNDWNTWQQKNAELVQTVTQQHAEIATFLHLERELARIPLVEEMPIAFDGKGQRLPTSSRWHPLSLAHVDLSDRDLSRRYLGQANLHNARLRGTNFFMADLSGADLSGADLSGADLTGANLSHADLHNAILLNTNLQVADMQNTILFGANLHGTRNLSRQQLDTAIYDASSQLDADFDLTIPRLPRINKTMLTSISSASTPSTRHPQPMLADISTIPDTPIAKARKRATTPKASLMANFTEVEIPDLDVSSTPVSSKQASPSPAIPTTDEIIEGEITEINDAVPFEVESMTDTSLSEPADAEIHEINDAEIPETDQPSATLESPIIASKPTVLESEPAISESDSPYETPSEVSGSLEAESPTETSSSESEFVVLEIEQDRVGNGHANGNGNGHKRGASTGAQKGKSNSKRRSRTR